MAVNNNDSQPMLVYNQEKGSTIFKTARKMSRIQLKLALTLSSISLLLALTCVVALFPLLQIRPPGSKNGDLTENGLSACMACMMLTYDLSGDVSDDPLIRKLTRRVKDGEEVCCAYNSEQMSAMFELVSRKHQPTAEALPSYNASDFMFSPASAHKRIYPKHVSKNFKIPNIPRKPQICEFKRDDRYSIEHHRGVNVSRYGLKIIHRGLYYVYSSVQFRPQSTYSCQHFKYQVFDSKVTRSSGPSYWSDTLLRSSHTCCDACINSQESRFTGGLFILNPGDVIQVKVMGYELVHFTPHASYAGLAMLGSIPVDTK